MSATNPESSTMNTNFTPKIIGLFRLPASGKSTLLNGLKTQLGNSNILFFEGSERLLDGDLTAFKALDKKGQASARGKAIKSILKECKEKRCHGIVVGHAMFWLEGKAEGDWVFNQSDGAVYTHVLYLETETTTIRDRHHSDQLNGTRQRGGVPSVTHLSRWQFDERETLRKRCHERRILFISTLSDKASTLVKHFLDHSEQTNEERVLKELEHFSDPCQPKVDTMFVIDGDKTLAEVDVGMMLCKETGGEENQKALKKLFYNTDYAHPGFHQQMLFFQESCVDSKAEEVYDRVAQSITLYPELERMLHLAATKKHVGVVVVTSGIGRVWEKVLEKANLRDSVVVVGSGRLDAGFVVTPETKRSVVKHLQENTQATVWAFGDSRLDLPMMKEAKHAIVVVGNEETRSKSMSDYLDRAVSDQGLQARQLLLPPTVAPRLDVNVLPHVDIGKIITEAKLSQVHVLHATDRAVAKLLAGPTRDSAVAGAALRQAHRQVGEYLARTLLPDTVGLEEYGVTSVQGSLTKIHRIHHESKTTIVSIMRGGDPMALGVAEVLPSAMYVHAKEADQLKPAEIVGQSTVVLCDFVVNEGETMVNFVRRVRDLNSTAHIVMVAGVVQAGAVVEGSLLSKGIQNANPVSLVALRLSDNKYKGKGKTDIGARLFNTTGLEKI